MEIAAEIRDAVSAVARRYGIALVLLFGSFAAGNTRENSDIDIAVDSQEPLPPGVLPRLREALEESNITRVVEVVDLRDAEPAFRERVRREGIVWSGSASD